MCTTSPSASPADPQIETQKPTPTREELAAPFEKAEKSSPQFFELLSMDDAGLRTEIASGLESTDFKAHEETYFTLLKELNELGQYSKVQEIYEKFGTLNIIGSRAHLQYVEAVRNDPMRWLAKRELLLKNKDTNSNQPIVVKVPVTFLEKASWIISLLITTGILIIFLVSLKSGGGLGNILGKKFDPVEDVQHVNFADVIGNVEAKEELQDLVDYLRDPAKFEGVKVPKGVLMVGPPGTGKTLMARALAGEAGVPFITASGSEFEEVFVGVGAKRIRQLFADARKQAPCIIFIDEIDAVGGTRDSFVRGQQMSLNQLLVELDGFNARDGIILIGATNMPSSLDSALVRPGRFDRKVYLTYPEPDERRAILDYYLSKHKVDADVSTKMLSRQTAGMSPADLENMVNWAAVETVKANKTVINMDFLEKALLNVAMGREKKSLLLSDQTKKITAYHEGGHALVALKAKSGPEIRKATLVPRGGALGMVNYLPNDEKMVTKSELEGRMMMAMGGRAAEELIFGAENVTTGASSDLDHATKIAYAMTTQYGMSSLGHTYISDATDPYTGKKKGDVVADSGEVDTEVRTILEEAYQGAKELLTTHEQELHLLAAALLKYETLDKEEIESVISGKTLDDKDRLIREEKADKERREKEQQQHS